MSIIDEEEAVFGRSLWKRIRREWEWSAILESVSSMCWPILQECGGLQVFVQPSATTPGKQSGEFERTQRPRQARYLFVFAKSGICSGISLSKQSTMGQYYDSFEDATTSLTRRWFRRQKSLPKPYLTSFCGTLTRTRAEVKLLRLCHAQYMCLLLPTSVKTRYISSAVSGS